jgi:hypothetical protein|tara:strand:+ start:2728 stop:3090 length:363 start_codon:yes stop_codon:yes gene_type:complete
MANEQNLKNWEKGVSGNPKGRPKGALGRATIVKQWMEAKQSLKNPISGELEMLSQEDAGTLALIHKMRQGDVAAYRALMDSLYGAVKQTMELSQAEQPIFKQLDIDVIEYDSPEEDSETT